MSAIVRVDGLVMTSSSSPHGWGVYPPTGSSTAPPLSSPEASRCCAFSHGESVVSGNLPAPPSKSTLTSIEVNTLSASVAGLYWASGTCRPATVMSRAWPSGGPTGPSVKPLSGEGLLVEREGRLGERAA